jgi:hypothetical protein
MQKILDSDCDKGIKRYYTTDGWAKKVKLEFEADEGGSFISLRSSGAYKLKVGYHYTIFSESDRDLSENCKKSKTYHKHTHIISHGHSVRIPWRIRLGSVGYALEIDILKLVPVDVKT